MPEQRRGRLFSQPGKKTATACPRLQRPRRVRCLNLTASVLDNKGAGYRVATPPMTARDMGNVDLIVLRDLSVADSMPHDSDFLLAMLAAVAFGITLVAKETWQSEDDPFVSDACVRHVPSLDKVPVTVLLTARFTQKHTKCAKVLQAASARPRSKWKVNKMTAADEDAKACCIDSLSDIAAFIRRVRRLLRPGDKLEGTLFAASSAKSLTCQGIVGSQRDASAGKGSGTEAPRGAALRALFPTSA